MTKSQPSPPDREHSTPVPSGRRWDRSDHATAPRSQSRPLTTDAAIPDGIRRRSSPVSASGRASLLVPCICLCLFVGGSSVTSGAFLPSSATRAVNGSPLDASRDVSSDVRCEPSGSLPEPRSNRCRSLWPRTPLRPFSCLRASTSPEYPAGPCDKRPYGLDGPVSNIGSDHRRRSPPARAESYHGTGQACCNENAPPPSPGPGGWPAKTAVRYRQRYQKR